MDLAKWLADFRVLHEKARKNALTRPEFDEYIAGRNELARAMLASQKMALQPGQQPRQALRASRVLPVEIDVHGRMRPFLTMDLASGGFSAILPDAPPAERPVAFSLKLPGGGEPVTGEAVCVQSVPQPGRCRCSFRFETVGAAERERIEMLVFDVLLEHIKG